MKKNFIYKFWCGNQKDPRSTGLETLNGVEIIVEASNEEKAREKARKMAKRDFYSLQVIKDL